MTLSLPHASPPLFSAPRRTRVPTFHSLPQGGAQPLSTAIDACRRSSAVAGIDPAAPNSRSCSRPRRCARRASQGLETEAGRGATRCLLWILLIVVHLLESFGHCSRPSSRSIRAFVSSGVRQEVGRALASRPANFPSTASTRASNICSSATSHSSRNRFMGVNFPYARSSFEVVEAVAERPERRLVVLAVDGDHAGGALDRGGGRGKRHHFPAL